MHVCGVRRHMETRNRTGFSVHDRPCPRHACYQSYTVVRRPGRSFREHRRQTAVTACTSRARLRRAASSVSYRTNVHFCARKHRVETDLSIGQRRVNGERATRWGTRSDDPYGNREDEPKRQVTRWGKSRWKGTRSSLTDDRVENTT